MAKRPRGSSLPTIGAPRPQAGPSYGGVDLTPPQSFQYDPTKLTTINGAIQQYGQAQNMANRANNQRYAQGLGVLAGQGGVANQQQAQGRQDLLTGQTGAQGYISQAIANSDQYGKSAMQAIQANLQNARGSSTQNAISRGLGNTTILDSMNAQNQRTADLATSQLTEDMANRRSALNLNQANTASQFAGQLAGQSNAQASGTRQGAGSVAGFIANRNDVAPNLGELASLVQGASKTGPGKMTGTVVNAPSSYTAGLGASTGGGYSPRSSSGGAPGGSSFGGGGGAGGGYQGGSGGQLYQGPGYGSLNLGPGGGAGESSNGVNPNTPGYQPWMGQAGTQVYNNPGATTVTPLPEAAAAPAATPQGSMSISAGQNSPTKTNTQPYKGQYMSALMIGSMGPGFYQQFINGGGTVTS